MFNRHADYSAKEAKDSWPMEIIINSMAYEIWGAMLYSQEYSNNPYPEPNQFNSHINTYF